MKKIITISSLAILILSSHLYSRDYHVDRSHHVKRGGGHYYNSHNHNKRAYFKRDHSHRYSKHIKRGHHHHKNHIHRDTHYFSHHGHDYYYENGIFYRSHLHGYRVVQAPIGVHIHSLPYGYKTIYIDGRECFVYRDTYYERYRGGYRTIRAPRDRHRHYRVNEIVWELPINAVEVIIDGHHYYKYGDIHFSLSLHNGRRGYRVVEIY